MAVLIDWLFNPWIGQVSGRFEGRLLVVFGIQPCHVYSGYVFHQPRFLHRGESQKPIESR